MFGHTVVAGSWRRAEKDDWSTRVGFADNGWLSRWFKTFSILYFIPVHAHTHYRTSLLYLVSAESVEDGMNRPDYQQSANAAPLPADNLLLVLLGLFVLPPQLRGVQLEKHTAISLLLLCQSDIPRGKRRTHEDRACFHEQRSMRMRRTQTGPREGLKETCDAAVRLEGSSTKAPSAARLKSRRPLERTETFNPPPHGSGH